jgi:hypothetical protein
MEPPATPTELGPVVWIEVDCVEESPDDEELLDIEVLPPEPVVVPLDCWARAGVPSARTKAATARSSRRRRIKFLRFS